MPRRITTETRIPVPSFLVELHVGGELRRAEQKEGRDAFVCHGLPLKEGDAVEVVVTGEGLQATGRTQVPHQPRIDKL